MRWNLGGIVSVPSRKQNHCDFWEKGFVTGITALLDWGMGMPEGHWWICRASKGLSWKGFGKVLRGCVSRNTFPVQGGGSQLPLVRGAIIWHSTWGEERLLLHFCLPDLPKFFF